MATAKESPVLITVPAPPAADKATNLFVYVVDSTGKVIETTPFKGTQASLTSSRATIKGSRAYVAPAFPKEFPAGQINARTLTSIGAYQVPMNFTAANTIAVQQLPSAILNLPPWNWCKVTGNVNNTSTINGGSVSGPVCNARVHICNVEWVYRWPIWLQPVIPAWVLAELQNKFKAILAPNFVPPIPDPGPIEIARSLKTNLPLASLSTSVLSATALSATPLATSTRRIIQKPNPLPANVHIEIQAATTKTISSVVLKYQEILYPYFCWWPIFWDWFYFVQEEAVVYTDCNGHFDASLFRFPTFTENIYVWVEVNINGQWVTVSRPPFPCNTHWNYACGTDINIHLANQSIPPCNCAGHVPEGSVWFTGIGNYGAAINIQQDVDHIVSVTQATNGPAAQTIAIKNVGCTNLYDSNQLSPFGRTLDFYLAFGLTPPSNGTIQATHYRWVKKLIKDSALNNVVAPASQVITGAVNRYYLWEDPITLQWHSGSIPLQDTDVHGAIAYQIPKYNVNSYPGVPANAEWEWFNFSSASYDSNNIPNGYLAEFDLQLMYKHPVNGFTALSVPVSSFQISKDSNVLDGSIPAPHTPDGLHNNYLTLDTANPANAVNLCLKVRVDNATTVADINDVWLLDNAGNPVPNGNSGPCGFIIYNDPAQKVRISFTASEPFNFANFSFEMWKGDSGDIHPETQSGYVFSNVGIYNMSTGTFTADVKIADLLGTCVGKAAFGAYLWVHSLATDGYNALWIYGAPYAASDNLAFALSNS